MVRSKAWTIFCPHYDRSYFVTILPKSRLRGSSAEQLSIRQQKRVSMSRSLVSRFCSLFFPSSGFCFRCCSWFRCSPPGFYSHSG